MKIMREKEGQEDERNLSGWAKGRREEREGKEGEEGMDWPTKSGELGVATKREEKGRRGWWGHLGQV